jgi:micrococcal nuclease
MTDPQPQRHRTARRGGAPRRGRVPVLRAALGLVLGLALGVAAFERQAPAPATGFTPGQTLSARVTHVLDGDTVDVTLVDTGRRVRIRIEGIDCPEAGQPFSQVARNFTRQSVFDRVVQISVVDVDRYGRLIARIRTPEGADLSVELVKSGLAWHYTQYSSDKLLAEAEREARIARRGLWVESSPVPPWVARRPQPRATVSQAGVLSSGPFVGNTRSRVFHRPTCRNATCQNCTVKFATEREAVAAGFRPAGDCFPAREP